MVKREILNTLRNLLVDYQEHGFLEDYNERPLLKVLEAIKNRGYFYLEKDLSKREQKTFLRMLKEFGKMDHYLDVPTGRALEVGYGNLLFSIVRLLTPKWKRCIGGVIGFCISCLLVGFLTQWLFHSFSAGVFLVVILRSIYEFIKFVPAIYIQNELLIRQQIKPTSKKTMTHTRENE